jgi:hypothetical protein
MSSLSTLAFKSANKIFVYQTNLFLSSHWKEFVKDDHIKLVNPVNTHTPIHFFEDQDHLYLSSERSFPSGFLINILHAFLTFPIYATFTAYHILPDFIILTMCKEGNRRRWAVHVAYMGKIRNACSIFVWKPERRHRHR